MSTAARMISRRALIAAAVGLVISGALFATGLIDLRLAGGFLLLAAAGGFYAELIRADGWASGGMTTYGVAVVALCIELCLPFLTWYDLWLTTFCGFGATLSAVTAACMPYLDRQKVPDMMDDVSSEDGALALPGKTLSPASQSQLLIFSQLVMLGNFLVVWGTIARNVVT